MPSISLKLIIGIQWLLVMWGVHWGAFTGSVFTWTNVTALAIGIWALADKQSVDAIFMFMMMLFLSIIIDIVLLSLYFPPKEVDGYMKFSVGMVIINLILKPFVILLLYQMYGDRGGEYNINFGPNNTAYDNIGNEERGTDGSTAAFNAPVIAKS